MPRPIKAENLNNPLVKLRGVFSPGGDEKPITQSELARIIDTALTRIRAIEHGARSFSSDLAEKIFLITQLRWNAGSKHWAFRSERVPMTYERWAIIKGSYGRRPANHRERIGNLHARMDFLFEAALERDWHVLANRIDGCLESCKADLKKKEKQTSISKQRRAQLRELEKLFQETSVEGSEEIYKRRTLPWLYKDDVSVELIPLANWRFALRVKPSPKSGRVDEPASSGEAAPGDDPGLEPLLVDPDVNRPDGDTRNCRRLADTEPVRSGDRIR